MGALVLEEPRVAPPVRQPGGMTLEDLVAGVWEELAAPPHLAACPVCAGALSARFGAGARPVGAVCRDCGSELS